MNLSFIQKSNLLTLGILCWGFAAMLGELLHIPALKGLGLASSAAPYTKVFCQAEARTDGRPFETFAAEFRLHYQLKDGKKINLKLTPEMYQKLEGPYLRRNVYGAVIAYAPALPENLKQATLHYALVTPGNLRSELNLPDDAHHFSIQMISRTQGSNDQWISKP